MVLKRLFLAALGALGLGALATGPAFSQIEPGTSIPAPKLYGDITSCAGGMLPDSSTAMGSMSLLGMGGVLDMALMGDRTVAAAQIDDTELGSLSGLLALTGDDVNCDNPVANGYNDAVTLYNEAQSARAALPAAGATPDADATARYEAAMAARDSYGGDVYNEVYNQRMQLAGVNMAVMAYNNLVGEDGVLNLVKTNMGSAGGYDDIVINDFGDRTVSGADDDETARLLAAEIAKFYGTGTAGYRAIAGNDVASDTSLVDTSTVDDPDGTRAAFNASGVLQFVTANSATADGRASSTIVNFGQIVSELGRWNMAVTAAQTAVDDAVEAGNLDTSALRETLRRATAGRDHVQSELTRLTRVVRSHNRDITDTSQVTVGTGTSAITYKKERDLLDAYSRAQSDVDTAANNVRNAVTALDNANKALRTQLADADAYLSQLVTLREYQLGVAQKNQADAGGADAAQSLKDAVDNARKAVTAARDLRTSHQALTGDPDSPAATLLTALLESDETKADDGLALVRAIDAVSEDSGAVSDNTEKNAMQDERLADHDEKLMAKAEYIGNLGEELEVDPATGNGTGEGGMSRLDRIDGDIDGLDGRVTANESRLDTHEMLVGQNTAAIATNAENIMTNAENIMTNAGNITANSARLDTHEMLVGQNAMDIDANADAIAANMSSIGENRSSIMRNAGMIGDLQDQMEVVRAGVAASMALAGMPAINGRGISIGVGSFDGESAFAVGFMVQGEMASFKVGLTSAGGETGASAGVGFQF